MSLDMSQRGSQKFQRIAKIVKTICGINLALKRYIQKSKVIQWVMNHLTRQSNFDKELLFNIHNFTKNKIMQSLLRKIQAFQVMPNIMQLEICQAAVYQQYDAKTIVLRKGHKSEACYFVLTGELVATLSDSFSENQNHLTGVLKEIQEGDLFGDAALLTNTKRPATILCKTNTELLLLNKEDFESILAGFLQQRYSAVTELLRTLPIFTPWTTEKLTLLSYSSLLRYDRSGAAVIPESSSSSFIVVVRSGRCDVVTSLKMGQHGTDLSQCPQQKKHFVGQKGFPMLGLLKQKTKLSERLSQRTSTSLSLALQHAQEITKTQQIRKSRCTRMTTSSHSVLKEDSFEELGHKDRSSSSRSVETVCERMIASVEDSNEIQEDYNSSDSCEEVEQHTEINKDLSLQVMQPSENASPIFVKIGRMERGGIFGLTEIPGSTCNLQLSLVSDGAECVFIPKRLFLDEAPYISRHAAMELVNTYPTEQIVRQNFARQQEWILYKTRLVKQLVSDSVKWRSGSVKPWKKTF
ncbi:cyclic nucleotide-binding domain-containing protein 2-like isoform X2 [Stegostoma tigrinum]|uniref:cyclic nucleotide-binding domain-containing protein 2-like isoform X2 n=1 Tax=Stegostoma tigrinum TaxID=3053191 RepID=UPI00287094BD|nr:cyclic nucleotide-binding domain-containing protein 2-like isoform X2 [Stegostoma tigrinum]